MSRSTLVAVLVFAVCALVAFSPGLLGDHVFFPLNPAEFLPWNGAEAPTVDWLGDPNPALSDKHWLFHPDNTLIAESWRRGQVPLWNPSILGGVSFLGQALYGTLYPPLALQLLFENLEHSYAPLAALHVFLAALGMYALLRRLRCPAPAATIGALVFAFGGPLAARYHYYMTFFPVVWVPWLLLAVDRFADRPDLARLLPIPIPIALIILTGFPQTGLYGVYLAAIWGTVRLLRGRGVGAVGPVVALGGAFAFAGVIAAGQLVPVIETQGESLQRERSADDQLRDRGSPWMLADYVLPNAFLDPRVEWSTSLLQNPFWNAIYCETLPVDADDPYAPPELTARPRSITASPNPTETSSYLGVLPLALAALGLLQRRWLAAALGIGITLGWAYTLGLPPLVHAAYRLPGWNIGELRRMLPTIHLLLSIAVASGLARWLERPRLGGLVIAVVALITLALAALTGVLWSLGSAGLADWLHSTTIDRYGMALPFSESQQQAHYDFVFQRAWQACAWSAGALLTLFVAAAWFRRERPLTGVTLCCLFVLADLGGAHFRYNPFVPADQFQRSHPLIEQLQAEAERGRVHRFVPPSATPLHPVRDAVIPPNTGAQYGIDDAQGYIVAVPTRYAHFQRWYAPDSVRVVLGLPLREVSSLHSPLLDVAAIRHLLTNAPLPEEASDTRFEEVYNDGVSYAYANRTAFDRVRLFARATFLEGNEEAHWNWILGQLDDATTAHDRPFLEGTAPSLPFARVDDESVTEVGTAVTLALTDAPSSIESVSRRAEQIDIEFGPGGGGFLYLAEGYDDGWSATIDGEPAEVYPANVAFRAIAVPPNARRIEFRYQPSEVYLALWVSVGSCALLLLLAGWAVLRHPTSVSEAA